MPVFGSFRMASSKACAVDASAGSRTFLMRGDGVAGASPTADDLGNAVTMSTSGHTKYQASPKYWSDYGTALYFDNSGYTTAGAPFNFGAAGAPFSLLLRPWFVTGGGGEVAQPILVTGNGFSSWGPGGQQNELRLVSPTTVRLNFYSGTSPFTFDIAAPASIMDSAHEVLITYDGTTTRGYIDGSLRASTTQAYTAIGGTLTARIGDPTEASYVRVGMTDFTAYASCLTTASSYTLPTLPPC